MPAQSLPALQVVAGAPTALQVVAGAPTALVIRRALNASTPENAVRGPASTQNDRHVEPTRWSRAPRPRCSSCPFALHSSPLTLQHEPRLALEAQIHRVIGQPLLGVMPIRTHGGDMTPEADRVIHLTPVHELVNDEVVAHAHRGLHDAPVQ